MQSNRSIRRTTTCTIGYPPSQLGAPSMAPIAPGTAPGENRSKLLELSATRFASQGYAQVSLRDLAAQLGVSTGAIYSNFRNKADLLAEVLGTRVLKDMERSERSRADLWLPDVVRESFLRLPERAQMRSLLLEAGTAARTDSELRDRLRPTLKALIDQWIEDYRAWQRFGHVDPDIDMAAVVTILWSVELGMGVLEAQDAVQVEPEVLAVIVGDFLESLVHEHRETPMAARRPAKSKQSAEPPAPSPIGLADESATRERLIDAAIELFAERGYAASTVRDLARSTGMTTGSIYGNFDNKAVLLAAAIEARLDRDLEYFPDSTVAPESSLALIEFHFARFALRARLRALLIEGAAAARSDADVQDRLRVVALDHEGRWVSEFTSRLGTINPAITEEIRRFVSLMWSAELGLGLLEAFDLPIPDPQTITTLFLQLFGQSDLSLPDERTGRAATGGRRSRP